MKVELHDHLGRPVATPATRVLIFDDFGNPIYFAIEQQPGHISARQLGDEDFFDRLRDYGIDKTVILTTLPRVGA